jgi:hypothetical protein
MVVGNTFRVTRSGSSDGGDSGGLPLGNSARVESGESGVVVKESEELDDDGGGVGSQCDFRFNAIGRRAGWGELAPDEVVLDVNVSPMVVNDSGSSFRRS